MRQKGKSKLIFNIFCGLYLIGMILYFVIGINVWDDKYWNLLYLPFLPQLAIWESYALYETLNTAGIIILEVFLSILLLPVTLTLIILIIPVMLIIAIIHLFCYIFRRKK